MQALTTAPARLALPSGYFSPLSATFHRKSLGHSIVFDKAVTMMVSNTPHTDVVFSPSLKRMHRSKTSGTPRHLTEPTIQQSAPPKRCFDVHGFTYGVVCGLFFISMFSVCLSVMFDVGTLEALPVRNVLSNQVRKGNEVVFGRRMRQIYPQ